MLAITLVISAPQYTGELPITNYSVESGNIKLSVSAWNDTVKENIT
jgi:hypothetical protein